ncbi:MAG TPA: class I SAM-dependent methyltransferase [Streptosporangiaceae bacterium]
MSPRASDAAGSAPGEHDRLGEHARRASSFGAAAHAYATHRPDYPAAAVAWSLEPAERLAARQGRPARVIDLGAGTGKLTAHLAALTLAGHRAEVTAVEPDPDMLAELHTQLPEVRAVAGRAEEIPLPDGAADAVLAGQAAHWFDLDLALPEIARVLAPGGAFAGLWNADDDRVGWVAGLHRISGRANVIAYSSLEDDKEEDGILRWLAGPGSGLFRPGEGAGFPHGQVRTAESLVATMRTHSMFLIMEPAERERVLGAVADYLAATPETASGEFTLPLWTMALRAVRR